jgi:hypothetical protein
MPMPNIDRVWARASQRPEYRGKSLSQYTTQVIVQAFTLTGTQVSGQTAVLFPAGAIIGRVIAAFQPSGQAATQTYRPSLDIFDVAIDYQATNRSIVGITRGVGSSVFGPFGDEFPIKELYIPINGSLLYTVSNLTSSSIYGTFAHHCLVPSAIG